MKETLYIAAVLEVVIVVVLLAMLFIAGKLIQYRKKARFRKRPLRIEANAIILNIETVGAFLNQRAQVKLQMQVLPEKGRNFVVETRAVFSSLDMASMQAGSMVRVRYDPSNPKELVLVKAA